MYQTDHKIVSVHVIDFCMVSMSMRRYTVKHGSKVPWGKGFRFFINVIHNSPYLKSYTVLK